MRIRPALALTCLAVACIAAPFEHSNYYDAKSGSRIAFTGLPDTVYSPRDTFEFTVTSSPAFPSNVAGATVTFASGRSLLGELGGFRYVPAGVTVFPQSVTFAAHVNPVRAWPVDTQVLWMVQHPVTLALSCFSAGCTTVAVNATTLAQVTGTDTFGAALAVPMNSLVFGSATSSDTLVFRVIGRAGPRINYQAVAAGTANLLFSAGGVNASMAITVVP